MIFPRRAGTPALTLALLTLAGLAASALAPTGASAQNERPNQPASPNGKVVFQSTQGSDGLTNDIFVMDADGRRQTRLTDDPGDDASALWSPRGDLIAFLSDRRSGGTFNYEIYLMNADGSNQQPLRAQEPVYANGFVWSPDGTRLAYEAGGKVFVVEVGGTAAPLNLSANNPAGLSDTEPSWSPDGTRLVVRHSALCGGCSDLYTVSADGTSRAQLTSADGYEANARWSPAGEQIAYEADRGGRGFYVINSDGTNEHLVSGAHGAFGDIAWSPDGTRLAFRAMTGSLVYAVGADGSGHIVLSDEPSSTGGIFWSPDGTKVGFHSGNADGWVDIYVANADGTSRRAANYTKTRRADEFAHSWQRVAAQ